MQRTWILWMRLLVGHRNCKHRLKVKSIAFLSKIWSVWFSYLVFYFASSLFGLFLLFFVENMIYYRIFVEGRPCFHSFSFFFFVYCFYVSYFLYGFGHFYFDNIFLSRSICVKLGFIIKIFLIRTYLISFKIFVACWFRIYQCPYKDHNKLNWYDP